MGILGFTLKLSWPKGLREGGEGEEMGSFKYFLRKFTEFVFPWFDY